MNGKVSAMEGQSKNKRFYSYFTIEPTMVLYMMAFMITSIVEQAFFVYKSCSVNHGYNDTICDNLSSSEYKDINEKVQVTVSNFIQWNDICGHSFQIILAFFIGAWSDRRGRKLPLLFGLLGKLVYSLMIIVNAFQKNWPVEYVIYTATIPMALTGADVAIFAAAFAYITDITSVKNRTLRVTLLEVCYLATMPTGIALGKVLFRGIVNGSYAIMFSINASLLALCIIYTLIRIEWRTISNQRPLKEADNILVDFFDYDHLVQTIKTIKKKRSLSKRKYLLLLMVAMGLYTFQREEKPYMYLYVQLVLKWTFDIFSNFKTYVFTVQDVFLLVAIPFLSKCLGLKDMYILMLGTICHSIGRIFYATANTGFLMYIGGSFAALGPIVAPIIRSFISKMVSTDERGKIFSLLSAADNGFPIFASILYTQIYNNTIHIHPAAIYYLTIATQIGIFCMATYIYFSDKNELFAKEMEEDTNETELKEINIKNRDEITNDLSNEG